MYAWVGVVVIFCCCCLICTTEKKSEPRITNTINARHSLSITHWIILFSFLSFTGFLLLGLVRFVFWIIVSMSDSLISYNSKDHCSHRCKNCLHLMRVLVFSYVDSNRYLLLTWLYYVINCWMCLFFICMAFWILFSLVLSLCRSVRARARAVIQNLFLYIVYSCCFPSFFFVGFCIIFFLHLSLLLSDRLELNCNCKTWNVTFNSVNMP